MLKDFYDKVYHIYRVNGYTFTREKDIEIYLIQQCGFTRAEALEYIFMLEIV